MDVDSVEGDRAEEPLLIDGDDDMGPAVGGGAGGAGVGSSDSASAGAENGAPRLGKDGKPLAGGAGAGGVGAGGEAGPGAGAGTAGPGAAIAAGAGGNDGKAGGKVEEPELEPWRAALARGAPVDVQDTEGDWCDAMVAEVGRDDVLIHFSYWTSHWDERLPRSSKRIAPYGSHIYLVGGEFRVGQKVDVYDEPGYKKFIPAHIVEGFTAKFDEVLPKTSARIAPAGTHTRVKHLYRPVTRRYWKGRKRRRFIDHGDSRLLEYQRVLGSKGLTVHPQLGDGNCLFRSVSHQIYGTGENHAIVRARCCDYMEREAAWFAGFVVGDASGFRQYLAEKRRDAVWGDDPEIQAMCELYDRPAEIYMYDPKEGAKLLRTFHESTDRTRIPMRLSYYGGGHYDSIVGSDTSDHWTTSRPGELEDAALAAVASGHSHVGSERKTAAAAGDDDAALDLALQRSRELFDNEGRNVEAAMLASMGGTPATVPTGDSVDPEQAARQASLLAAARRRAEEEAMQRALAASMAPDDPDAAMQRALQLSMQTGTPGLSRQPSDEDPAIAAALAASLAPADEDPHLAAALAMSMAAGGAGPAAGSGAAGSGEDPALAAALAASMADSGAGAGGAGGGDDDMGAGAGAGPVPVPVPGGYGQGGELPPGASQSVPGGAHGGSSALSEEEQLRIALALSSGGDAAMGVPEDGREEG